MISAAVLADRNAQKVTATWEEKPAWKIACKLARKAFNKHIHAIVEPGLGTFPSYMVFPCAQRYFMCTLLEFGRRFEGNMCGRGIARLLRVR